jgi:hypothetical protein
MDLDGLDGHVGISKIEIFCAWPPPIMSIVRNGRISTTFKYAKISGVPELSLLSLDREYSDGSYQPTVSGSSAASGAEERRKISRAEGCFITKQPGFHLEKAHWVNAVRKNALLKYEVVRTVIEYPSPVFKHVDKLFDLGNLPQRFTYCSR